MKSQKLLWTALLIAALNLGGCFHLIASKGGTSTTQEKGGTSTTQEKQVPDRD